MSNRQQRVVSSDGTRRVAVERVDTFFFGIVHEINEFGASEK